MNSQREGTLALVAAILILFAAMVDPVISFTVAVLSLVAFAIYKLRRPVL